ncbi:MAG TPA: beta-propeller domain-containing protein, partial [Pirellulaceae bacterium]
MNQRHSLFHGIPHTPGTPHGNRRKSARRCRAVLRTEQLEDRRVFACGDLNALLIPETRGNDYFEVQAGVVDRSLDVLANDWLREPGGSSAVITSVTVPLGGGRIRIAADGRSLVYSSGERSQERDCFSYTVNSTQTWDVSIQTVGPVNVEFDTFTFQADPQRTDNSLDVLANDVFAADYGGPRRITAASLSGSLGSLTIAPDGRRLQFQPDTLQPGTYVFDYTVDGEFTGQGHVYVFAGVVDDTVTLTQSVVESSIGVLANDSFVGNELQPYTGSQRITDIGPSARGGTTRIAADGRSVLYLPAAGFAGRDSFTYTVDGIQQATVFVDVTRPTRNDQYHIPINSAETSLPVLLNDRFGREYAGERQITSVTAGDQGGQARISEDGTRILYRPAPDFQGTETLHYLVDGQFTTEILVRVDTTFEDRFPRFESLPALQEFLIQDALDRYAEQFGQEAWNGSWWNYADVMPGTPGLELVFSTAGVANVSATNVQVTGVDEGDIVETDGDFLYILRGGELVIARARPAEDLEVASRVRTDGFALAEFLLGDRLTVISRPNQDWSSVDDFPRPIPFQPGILVDSLWPGSFNYRQATTVTVYDVSDRNHPTIVQTTKLDGSYRDARVLGDHVFVTLDHGGFMLPGPNLEPATGTELGRGRYETRETYLTRVRAEIASLTEDLLPKYSSYNGHGQLVRTGLVATPEELHQPLGGDGRQMLSVVSLDMRANEPGIVASSAVLGSGAAHVYASQESLYVFDQGYNDLDGNLTRILKFRWNGANGSIEFAARGELAGMLNNQFSADEHEGILRIATTSRDTSVADWTMQSVNDVWILREDTGLLELIGAARDIAPGETIQSARFVGDRGFLVTFRQIDPLFALDLSDPENPQVMGELEVPGFSAYLQFVDENHILGIGQSATFTPQLMLFDVSDLTQPTLIDSFVFEEIGWGAVAYDHHVVGWYADAGVLAIPFATGAFETIDENGDGIPESSGYVSRNELRLFSIDTHTEGPSDDGIRALGSVEHPSVVLRSVAIDDVLYSIGTNEVMAVDITDPTHSVAVLPLGDVPQPGPPPVGGPSETPDPRDDGAISQAVAAARVALQRSLHMPGDSFLFVASEPKENGHHLVFRHQDQLIQVGCDTSGVAEIVDGAFEFAASRTALAWHNDQIREDVDGNGVISPRDALLIINRLIMENDRPLAEMTTLRSIQLTEVLES